MSENKPKLIIGLGNPGPEYADTRHNLGFIMLDALAEKFDASWHAKPKFKALLAETSIEGHKVILAKPTTFYNLSGEAAAAIAHFYKLQPGDILAIHDELDLPFGTLRARLGGSDAGNNGIKSLIAHLGSGFARIRIGIGEAQRDRNQAADFVLSNISTTTDPALIESVIRLTSIFLTDPTRFNTTTTHKNTTD